MSFRGEECGSEDGRSDLRKPFLHTESWYRMVGGMGSRQSSLMAASTMVIRDSSISVVLYTFIVALGPIQNGFTGGYSSPTQDDIIADLGLKLSEVMSHYVPFVSPDLGLRTLNLTASSATAPSCTVNHSVPAVVFNTGGHCGNCFHDFADVLIPLFEIVAPFRGKVRFVIASRQGWWMHKYRPYLARLSVYDIIDLDNDTGVHCFPRVIVGLRAGRDLLIDPTAKKSAGEGPPGNSSIADFVALTQSAYGLPRERVETGFGKQKKQKKKRPRILFIARGRTRRFENMEAVRRTPKCLKNHPLPSKRRELAFISTQDFRPCLRFVRCIRSSQLNILRKRSFLRILSTYQRPLRLLLLSSNACTLWPV